MIVNWPERIWVNSPVRRYVQQQEGRFFRRMSTLAPGGKCLEIGCGCGVGAKIINQAFAPAAIHALDLDVDMLYAAKKKKNGWNNVPLHLLAGDAQELPYPDRCFDAVFNYGIIHHLENWQKGVAEIVRVLKDGGVFFFEEIYPPLYANPLFRRILQHPRENRFHGPEYRAALAESGLRLLDGYKESRFAILGVAVKESEECEVRM
ncbi:MAG: ubiquinone biosynthesis protein UbiE [Desulfobulbaceae bacterium BRH_c16a]|nr:MAG: ubiquinone biosynthesis protein UbiE [Desulfobulbaceae bacterium BRH_c16a]